MICLAGILLLLPQTPGFVVENRASTEREELVRASLPLPRGRFRDLAFVEVDGGRAPTTPLVTWPDGSLALVQIHARVRLAAGERRRFAVVLPPGTPLICGTSPGSDISAPDTRHLSCTSESDACCRWRLQ